jgi:hypothetical protein
MALQHNSSQIATWTPSMSNPMWLGQIGHVNGLKYSWTVPGGPDQLTCNLMVSASTRTPATDPGRIVQLYRGGGVIWEGILSEPAPSASNGWAITAVGAGNYGVNYDAIYTGTWPGTVPDDAVNQAIARGMRWVNPGIGTPSGIWLGQAVDSGAQTVNDLLNLNCTYGGLTWSVTTTPAGNILSMFALPTTVNELLLVRQPAPRTLGGDINVVWLRYESAADNATTGVPAVFSVTSATVPASIALHGRREAYLDLSSAGLLSAGAAQAVGNSLLQRYQRASFAGPFAAGPGDLMTTGGQAIDLGINHAGRVVQLVLTDYAYGGEVVLGPVTFMIGGYAYDDDALTGTVTPFQYLDLSFTGLMSAASTTLPQPAAVLAPAA